MSAENEMIYSIKKFLKIYIFNEKIKYTTTNHKAYIFLAANYGNLGDVAITYAQKQFIKKVLPNYEIIDVPIEKVYRYYKYIKKNLSKEDIITIIGGGNSGDKYIEFERIRRFIIKKFKNNKVISFPQTIDFSNTKNGNKEFKRSIKAYNENENLYLFAREKKSYDIYKKYCNKEKVYCVPDIVLSLDESNKNKSERKIEVVFSLRNDSEKKVNIQFEKDLINEIINKYQNVMFRDTHIGNDFSNKEELIIELKNIWSDFENAKIVITDRLHGMIFCAITGTPCIVLPNSNHKIKESYYNWLNDVNYIYFFEDINKEKIFDIISKYNNKKELNVAKIFQEEYTSLVNILKK